MVQDRREGENRVSQTRVDFRTPTPVLAWLPRLSPALWTAAAVLAVVAAVLPGLWTLAGLGGLIVCTILLTRPDLAVYLLALSVPLGSLTEVNLTKSLTVSSTEGLAALLAIGWAARAFARRRVVIPMTSLLIPLVVMVAVVATSAFQATDLALTAKETLKWLELLLVYLYIVAEMGTVRQVMILLGFLFAGAVIEAFIGLGQFVLGIGPEAFAIGHFMRAFGTFEQPNPYAGYLGMLIPMAVGFLLARPAPRARNAVLAVLMLAVAGVTASLSRGAWMGIGLAICVMMVFWSQRSRLVLATGALASTPLAALAFMNLLPPEISNRLATAVDYFRFIDPRQEVLTPDNWAVIERVAHWQAALDMIAAHPLLGVGAGNYPAVYEQYMVQGWSEPLGHAHNFYLNIAAETGMLGLFAYLAVLVVAATFTVKWLVRSGRPGDLTALPLWRGIMLGVLGTLVASAVHNMFDSLFVHGMSVQLGIILALAQLAATGLLGQLSPSRSQPIS
jgi:putative inorganic carbon (hco3(-)) transporter